MDYKRINCRLMTLVIILSLFFCVNTNDEVIAAVYESVKLNDSSPSYLGKKNDFIKGKTYYGFELEEIKNNDGEILRKFVHKRSGAKLFSVRNSDNNKHFSISFRTPSYDNKGAAHVLEHCVLVGGSKKYPVKQLLKEVLETSLSKDLNGVTTSDTTIYPFSSTNEKEFTNIMDIYLDMVFNPFFYNDKRIFDEEGWYYEAEDNELKYNGVVYNEMKGALSSANGALYSSICKSLFPHTTYSFISGGDPTYITDLTFDELKDFHKKYYHPSNAYMYLYGDMDLNSKLKEINDNYLSKYKSKGIDSQIESEETFTSTRNIEYTYALEKDQDIKNKSVLTYNFAIDEKRADTDLAMNMLDSLLISNPNSTIYKNLHSSGFNNVSGSYITNLKQSFYSIVATNCNEEDKDEFVEIIEDSLLGAYINGIDRKIIKNEINKIDLNGRWYGEGTKNKGAEINRRILDRWVYNLNPMSSFITENEFKNIMNAGENYYFEELIEKNFINNSHKSVMVLKAEKGLEEKSNSKELNKLNAFKKKLTTEEYKNLINATKDLKVWQDSKNDEDNISKIPKLSIEDVHPQVDLLSSCKRDEKQIDILYHPFDTNNTSKINLYFNLKNIKQEELSYVKLLVSLLGRVGTSNYSVNDIYEKMDSLSAGVNYGLDLFTDYNKNNDIAAYLKVSTLSMNNKLNEVLALVNEQILNSDFSDKNIMKQYLSNISIQNSNVINECSDLIGINRNLSYYYKEKAVSESFWGLSYIDFIKDINKNYDNNSQNIIKTLQGVSKKIFNKDNLTVSLTTDAEGYEIFKKSVDSLIKNMPTDKESVAIWSFKPSKKVEGIGCASKVLYNTQGFNYKSLAYKYNGNMKVLKNILELDYLWNKIRVNGGAYGANIIMNAKGVMAISSYRDPNLTKTLEAYNGIPRYLSELKLTNKELDSYKISALAEYCNSKSLDEKIAYADSMYFSNTKRSDIEKELWEIKMTTIKSIKSYEAMFREGLDSNFITVVGNTKEITKNKSRFTVIK